MSVLRREYNEELLVGSYGSRRYQMKVSIFKLEEDGSLQNSLPQGIMLFMKILKGITVCVYFFEVFV